MTLHEQIWRLGVTLHAYGYGGKIAFDLDKYPNPENRPCIKVFGGQTDIIDAYISQDGGEMQFTHPQGATMSVFPRAATEQDLIDYGIDAILPPKETWIKNQNKFAKSDFSLYLCIVKLKRPEDYIMKENSNVYVILHHAYDESGTDYTEVMGVYTNVETAKKDLSLFFEEIDMGYEGYHVTESNCDTKMTIRADTWEYYDELEIVESPLVTE